MNMEMRQQNPSKPPRSLEGKNQYFPAYANPLMY